MKEKPVESITAIDENALDEEWVNHPTKFHKYALRLANAKTMLAESKASLDVVEAEISLRVRKNPLKYGMDGKITEAVINATVLLNPKYQEALTEVTNAKHKVDILQAAVDALEHKKRALENLVTLHGQSYFASPRVSKEAGEAMKSEMDTAVKRKVRSKGKVEK